MKRKASVRKCKFCGYSLVFYNLGFRIGGFKAILVIDYCYYLGVL